MCVRVCVCACACVPAISISSTLGLTWTLRACSPAIFPQATVYTKKLHRLAREWQKLSFKSDLPRWKYPLLKISIPCRLYSKYTTRRHKQTHIAALIYEYPHRCQNDLSLHWENLRRCLSRQLLRYMASIHSVPESITNGSESDWCAF